MDPIGSTYYLSDWGRMLDILHKLEKLSWLEKNIFNVYSLFSQYELEKSELNVSSDKYYKLLNQVTVILNDLDAVCRLYESLGYQENDNNLDILLPEGIDLAELSSITHELELIFQQCPFINMEGKVGQVAKMDVGSMWLVLAGTTVFLREIGNFIDFSLKVKSKKIALEEQQERLRTRELKNDVLQTMCTALEQIADLEIKDCISELENKSSVKLEGPEEESRLLMCADKLNAIIDKGVHLYASINSDSEIQAIFPEQQEIPLIFSMKEKLLEDKENQDI